MLLFSVSYADYHWCCVANDFFQPSKFLCYSWVFEGVTLLWEQIFFDKHSSLFCLAVNYNEKDFITLKTENLPLTIPTGPSTDLRMTRTDTPLRIRLIRTERSLRIRYRSIHNAPCSS
jgi:hypothetical protein